MQQQQFSYFNNILMKKGIYMRRVEGTQRFIRVNVYYCSSSSLLATFAEQDKIFFRKD